MARIGARSCLLDLCDSFDGNRRLLKAAGDIMGRAEGGGCGLSGGGVLDRGGEETVGGWKLARDGGSRRDGGIVEILK